jgi:hypothetical protein
MRTNKKIMLHGGKGREITNKAGNVVSIKIYILFSKLFNSFDVRG